jgi:RimJ/RimL family protein N-acetyltransferase
VEAVLGIESIQTARLTLRRPRVADATAIFNNYASDPEATRFLTWRPHANVEPIESWLNGLTDTWGRGQELSWVICHGSSVSAPEPIGMISLRLAGFKAELGYVIGRAYWGQGLMPEAVRAIVALCFRESLYRVAAFCDVENARSARVLEKVGMVREGLLHRYASHPNISAEPRDVYFYAAYR